jgi:hypothetical protein
MRGLSGQELLRIWEVAQYQHPVDKALTILNVALPDVPRDDVLALSIGQRDTHLSIVRQATFGSQCTGFAECPACQERSEFTFDLADIHTVSGQIPADAPLEGTLTFEDYELRFRLPNSLDLADIARFRDVLAARNLLIQRCVLQISQHGDELAMADLPESVMAVLAERMGKCDPQAEVQLNLSCPVCDNSWSAMFDIVSFFWSEICVQAKRLLREVHTLARAYGWREADILSLSVARRQFYLEMVT